MRFRLEDEVDTFFGRGEVPRRSPVELRSTVRSILL